MYRYHGIRPTPEALSLEISWGRRMLASWYHRKELQGISPHNLVYQIHNQRRHYVRCLSWKPTYREQEDIQAISLYTQGYDTLLSFLYLDGIHSYLLFKPQDRGSKIVRFIPAFEVNCFVRRPTIFSMAYSFGLGGCLRESLFFLFLVAC